MTRIEQLKMAQEILRLEIQVKQQEIEKIDIEIGLEKLIDRARGLYGDIT
jgi:hypothetical protein